MNIVYFLGELNENKNSIEVTFTCEEHNLSTTRLINIPKSIGGQTNQELFDIILEKQLVGVEKEFSSMI